MKKVAILTLPLHINFGGNLQAFALFTVLKDLGYDVDLLNIQNEKTKLFGFFLNVCKQFVKSYLLFKPVSYLFLEKEKELIYKNHSDFISKYLKKSNIIYDKQSFKSVVAEERYGAVIVGSDQVWRKDYVKNIETYFLNDVENLETKKIAYAASFGVEEWQFNFAETSRLKNLIHQFKYISVREDTAVRLCKDNLDIDVEHVLDPTLLLEKNTYKKLLSNKKSENYGKVFAYILDENEEKISFVNKVSELLLKKNFSIKIKENKDRVFINNINEYCVPDIEDWLKAFDDASFIITDSFHGVAFSIIFNKPFIAIVNNKRGSTRFNSMLNLFDLNERAFKDTWSEAEITQAVFSEIDYHKINKKISDYRYSIINKLKSLIWMCRLKCWKFTLYH
ncbi:MAG: polysaccharide pyruvyl transferase family protein [Malacoplasma sp.]